MEQARTRDQERTLAPWAEIVPGAGPTTVNDLLALADDGGRYEVVEGLLVRMPRSEKRANTVSVNVHTALRAYVQPQRLGVVTPADGVYRFPGAETGLVPELGYYVAERDALVEDEDKPIPFAPDLAVEVASPTQGAAGVATKARLYLRGGVQLVWVVWPASARVDVWRRTDQPPAHAEGHGTTLQVGDTLAGEDVVPDFELTVAEVFARPLPDAERAGTGDSVRCCPSQSTAHAPAVEPELFRDASGYAWLSSSTAIDLGCIHARSTI